MANKSFIRGQDPKESMDIGISRGRKLLLKKVVYFYKLIVLEIVFDREQENVECFEDYVNRFNVVGDRKIKFSEEEEDWMWWELRKIMGDIICVGYDEIEKTETELEKIKKEQIERIKNRSM